MQLPLRIAILETCPLRPPMQEKYGGYRKLYTNLLQQAADSIHHPGLGFDGLLQITCWDVVAHEDEYPDLADIDAVLIAGSKHDSFNNEPWNLQLIDYTKKVLADARVRAIGVCYGHQIIGRALGASVGRSHRGWELSVTALDLTELGKSVFKQDTLSIFQIHQDEISGMPLGVQLLASTAKCENQGMYQKGRLISVQGHPEYTAEIVECVMYARRDVIAPGDFENGLRRLKDHDDGVVIARAFLRFLLEDD